MTRVLLTRHGETDYNREDRKQGQMDIALNQRGEQQAQRLAERVEHMEFDRIYASTLQRAQTTAEIIAEKHDQDVYTIEELQERSYGVYEGQLKEHIKEKTPSTEPLKDYHPERGETLEETAERALSALEQIRKQHPDETILAVAHGAVNRATISSMMDTDPGYANKITQGNTCINEFEYDGHVDGWQIRRVNDTAHLNDPYL